MRLPVFPRCLGSLAALAVSYCGSGVLFAQVPTIHQFVPQAIRPGASAVVKIRGANLAAASQLWISGGVEAKPTLPASSAEATFQVTVPAHTPVGLCAARLATSKGVSGTRLILVDDLPTIAQVRGNHSPQTAQAISFPAAVDGYIASLSRDYYRITVASGQRVSFEVLGQRLGSPLDAMLRILDKRGQEITYAEDTPGIGADPQLSYTFRDGGEYLVEVRDIRYQGSEQAVYRLRIGDFPCISSAYPLGVKRGVGASVSFVGINGAEAESVAVNLTSQETANWLNIGGKIPGGRSSGFAILSVGNADEVLEAEPNDTNSQATRVPLGANINGRFQKAHDFDRYVFTAKAGRRYTFSGITRSQGSPSDLYLRLLKGDGTEISAVEDVGSLEGRLDYTFPTDGDYILAVEELTGRGGPDSVYRIEVQPYAEPFTLATSADVVNIPQGGAAFLTVTANRGIFKGPITLALEGAPPGITAAPSQIDVNQTQGVLVLRAAPQIAGGTIHSVKVVGQTMQDGQVRVATATVIDALKVALNGLQPPPNLASAFAVGVSAAPSFTVKSEQLELTLGKNLSATGRILAVRTPDATEEIALALVPAKRTIPQALNVSLKPIGKGAQDVAYTISADDTLAIGDYTVVVSGTVKKGDVATTQPVLTPVLVKIREPFALQGKLVAAKSPQGSALRVKVTVNRNPAFRGAVALSVSKLPAGVTVAPVSIPADKTEGELVLSAAMPSAWANVKSIVIQGTGSGDKGKPVTAASGTVALALP